MTRIHTLNGLAVLGVIASVQAPQALAQSVEVGVEATTDEVRRGLSWSGRRRWCANSLPAWAACPMSMSRWRRCRGRVWAGALG